MSERQAVRWTNLIFDFWCIQFNFRGGVVYPKKVRSRSFAWRFPKEGHRNRGYWLIIADVSQWQHDKIKQVQRPKGHANMPTMPGRLPRLEAIQPNPRINKGETWSIHPPWRSSCLDDSKCHQPRHAAAGGVASSLVPADKSPSKAMPATPAAAPMANGNSEALGAGGGAGVTDASKKMLERDTSNAFYI